MNKNSLNIFVVILAGVFIFGLPALGYTACGIETGANVGVEIVNIELNEDNVSFVETCNELDNNSTQNNTEIKESNVVATETQVVGGGSNMGVGNTKSVMTPRGELVPIGAPFFADFDLSRTVRVGDAFNYVVRAQDLENDILRFSLLRAPEGMTINDLTGMITWNVINVADATVQVAVSDGTYETQKNFTLVVSPAIEHAILNIQDKTVSRNISEDKKIEEVKDKITAFRTLVINNLVTAADEEDSVNNVDVLLKTVREEQKRSFTRIVAANIGNAFQSVARWMKNLIAL